MASAEAAALRRRAEVVIRIFLRGSAPLVAALCARLEADRGLASGAGVQAIPAWGDVADRACAEGLLGRDERAALLWVAGGNEEGGGRTVGWPPLRAPGQGRGKTSGNHGGT